MKRMVGVTSPFRSLIECHFMQKATLLSLMLFGAIAFVSCEKPEETFTEVPNGQFTILIRSQEFGRSAIRDVDVCVVETPSRGFPKHKAQCFLHGFDFSGLSAKWQSGREIKVSFRGGRVTYFTNSAIVFPDGSVPVEFHTTLCDGCIGPS